MRLPGPEKLERPIAPLACRTRTARVITSGLLALGILALVTSFLDDAARVLDLERIAPRQVAASGAIASTDTYTNCRFGTGQVYRPITTYDTASLNLGWYLDWGTSTNPKRPQGIEYVQMLRTSDGAGSLGSNHPGPLTYTPSGSTLEGLITANPGALWLIGNEPDCTCVNQDNVLPQNYAQIYHDAYAFIKARDPSARVAVGGIVQPTPLRMAYLDIVLDTYASLYGQPLPTDAWHIHSFILREASCETYPYSCWGCMIPPGITADHGELYEVEQTDNLTIFQQRLVQFRQWMKDKGYRDTPLIITEYGTLMPHDYGGFDEERGRTFMYGTFDYLLTASDSDTGYPVDENRLVQRWLWYSLDDGNYGGTLFDKDTANLLPMGTYYSTYTSGITPTNDLYAVRVEQVAPVPLSPMSNATITLEALASNVGNAPITRTVTIRFYDDAEHQIGSDQVIAGPLAGCADVYTASVVWADVAPGAHTVKVVVDPSDGIPESNEGNNQVYGMVMVAKAQIHLPLATR